MEITREENPQSSEISVGDRDQPSENAIPDQEDREFKEAEATFTISDEEIKAVMEPIAATGKFWCEWEELKNILSFRLKQVLAEYPESQVENDGNSLHESLTNESYPDLVRRLNEVLLSFTEGPPFTLQRLCEILLAPRTLYPKLSKLALAMEKVWNHENPTPLSDLYHNLSPLQILLVTSTLTRSTEPLAMVKPEAEPESTNGRLNRASELATNNEDTEMVDADTEVEGSTIDEVKQAETPKDQGGNDSGESHA